MPPRAAAAAASASSKTSSKSEEESQPPKKSTKQPQKEVQQAAEEEEESSSMEESEEGEEEREEEKGASDDEAQKESDATADSEEDHPNAVPVSMLRSVLALFFEDAQMGPAAGISYLPKPLVDLIFSYASSPPRSGLVCLQMNDIGDMIYAFNEGGLRRELMDELPELCQRLKSRFQARLKAVRKKAGAAEEENFKAGMEEADSDFDSDSDSDSDPDRAWQEAALLKWCVSRALQRNSNATLETLMRDWIATEMRMGDAMALLGREWRVLDPTEEKLRETLT